MATVYKFSFDARSLQNLPLEERVLLLLLGYAANQITMLQRLIWYCTNGPLHDYEAEQLGNLAQSSMLLRLLVGVLSESWRLVSTRYLQSKLGREYGPLLSPTGAQSLGNLKKQFGKGSLITSIRNNYAFHFPDNSDLEAAFEAAAKSADAGQNWSAYFSRYNANTLFQLSEFVLNRGVMLQIGVEDELESHRLMMKELGSAANDVVVFAQSFFAATWKRRFEEAEPPAQQIAPGADPDAVRLPFIVEPPRSSRNHTALNTND